jgi:hypothetical protein
MLGMSVFVAQQSYMTGDPWRLGYPNDPDGMICGHSAGYENYPYIFWAKPNYNL